MVDEGERFGETGGYSHSLLDNNQVFEKSMETYGGDYARGQRNYSTGQHRIRLQLEAVSSHEAANRVLVGIISAGVTAKDQYFNRTPSTYAWRTASFEWETHNVIVENGEHKNISKHQWCGAKIGDILELTIDCDNQIINLDNQTQAREDSMKIDLTKCPLPWKLIVIFSTHPDRIRLL